MQTIKEKMIPAFRDANGGLFQAVEKADVGSAYQDPGKAGCCPDGLGGSLYAGIVRCRNR